MRLMQSFDTSLPMILYRALDAIMPAYRDLFARYDVTEQQWRVLRAIWTSERVTSAELASRTLLTPPSLVGIIDRLEKKGFVSRVRSLEDRRSTYVVATAAGRALQQDVAPHLDEIDQRLRAAVPQQHWQAMEDTLLKVAAEAAPHNQHRIAG